MTTAMFMTGVDKELKKTVKSVLICGIIEFDEQVELEKVKTIAKDRLFSIPRLRCRPKEGEGGEIMLEYLDEDEMELAYHVQSVEQEGPWNAGDLDKFISGIYEDGLDNAKPHWVLWIINDINGKCYVLITIDHALVDGSSAIAVLMSILDEPEDSEPAPKCVPLQKRPKPKVSMLNYARAITNGIKVGLLGPLMPVDKPNRLKIKDHRNPGTVKTMATSADIDLNRVKKLKHKFENATVTDILMSVMTITLRRYFEEFGEVPDNIRGNFPIDLRPAGEDVLNVSLGNRFASSTFKFNLKFSSIEEVVYSTKAQADLIKNSPGPIIEAWVLGKLVPMLSKDSSKRGQLWKMILDTYGKVTGMLSSNMGPQTQAFFAGKAVERLRFYALVPMGLYFGIISYNGNISVGVSLDSTCGDANDLAKHWGPAFEELWNVAEKYEGQVPRKDQSSISMHLPSMLIGMAAGVMMLGWFYFATFLLAIAFFAWA